MGDRLGSGFIVLLVMVLVVVMGGCGFLSGGDKEDGEGVEEGTGLGDGGVGVFLSNFCLVVGCCLMISFSSSSSR